MELIDSYMKVQNSILYCIMYNGSDICDVEVFCDTPTARQGWLHSMCGTDDPQLRTQFREDLTIYDVSPFQVDAYIQSLKADFVTTCINELPTHWE